MNTAEPVTVQIECKAETAEVIRAILNLAEAPDVITSAEELDELENELRQHANELCGHVVEKRIQHSLDSEEGREAQRQLLEAYPHRMQDKGKEDIRVRTGCGCEIMVRTRYFTGKAKRWGKKRYPGLYPGLLVLGIHERCTPGLASEVKLAVGDAGFFGRGEKSTGGARDGAQHQDGEANCIPFC